MFVEVIIPILYLVSILAVFVLERYGLLANGISYPKFSNLRDM